MRVVYTLLWALAAPWLPLRLWWRGRKEPTYRTRIGERYGFYRAAAQPVAIWVHAVSAGEMRAAAPLIERLLRERPRDRVLLTTMTATGDAAAQALFGDRVVRAWLPYDIPPAIARFLAHFAPRAGLVMETEVWPNLMRACARRRTPVYLVNARLSARSAAGYARIGALARATFAAFAGVAAQGDDDRARLVATGAHDVVVCGNIKFDMEPASGASGVERALRERIGARPVFVAASTRDGEEALLVDALRAAPLPDDALTLLVPRHPQRFDEVAALLQARGCAFARRSDAGPVPPAVAFLLGDSMGEMPAYYALADVAFVGGSLLPLGGQNLIEPIALGVPTLVGTHTFNFAETADAAVAAGAATRVADARDLVTQVGALLRDPAKSAAMRERALAFHAANRGAIDRLWQWLAPQLARALAEPSRA